MASVSRKVKFITRIKYECMIINIYTIHTKEFIAAAAAWSPPTTFSIHHALGCSLSYIHWIEIILKCVQACFGKPFDLRQIYIY